MPRVGKLTIAKNIADHYPHFALVHNHLSLDVANQVFTFPEVCQPIDWIESEVIETSALSVGAVVEKVINVMEK